MKFNSTDFRVSTGKTVRLEEWPNLAKAAYKSRLRDKLNAHNVPEPVRFAVAAKPD